MGGDIEVEPERVRAVEHEVSMTSFSDHLSLDHWTAYCYMDMDTAEALDWLREVYRSDHADDPRTESCQQPPI